MSGCAGSGWSPHGALVNVVRVPGAGGGQWPGLDGGDGGSGQTPGGQGLCNKGDMTHWRHIET